MVGLILKIGITAGGILCALMMALVAGEVVTRSLFNFSLLVTDEYTGYMVVAMVFLGIPYALYHEALLRVDFLFNRLKGTRRQVVGLIFDFISLGVTGILGWFLGRMVWTTFQRGTFSSTPTMTPLWVPQVFMPIGMLLLALILVARIVDRFRILRGLPPRHAVPDSAQPEASKA